MKGKAVNATMQWSLQSKSLSSLLLAIVVIDSVNILIPVQLTFTEFHFETEAKVDFPSACI